MIELKDAITSEAVLKSQNFEVPPLADMYIKLSKAIGIDFNAIIDLMKVLPVFVEGSKHSEIRKSLARQMKETNLSQELVVEIKVKEFFDDITNNPRKIDLVSEFLKPLWRDISSVISPLNYDISGLIDNIPLLINPSLSLKKRMEINDLLENFLGKHQQKRDEYLYKLCLVVLGARPFVGSIAHSLYDIIYTYKTSEPTDIVWPQIIPISSIRYAERYCKQDLGFGNIDFKKNDHIRCYTQYSEYSEMDNENLLFGVGRHSCLGKNISEYTWQRIGYYIKSSSRHFYPCHILMEENCNPFCMPKEAVITIL